MLSEAVKSCRGLLIQKEPAACSRTADGGELCTQPSGQAQHLSTSAVGSCKPEACRRQQAKCRCSVQARSMLGPAMLVDMLPEQGACLGQQGSCSALSEPVASWATGLSQQGRGNCRAHTRLRRRRQTQHKTTSHRPGAQRASCLLCAAGRPATPAGPAAPANNPDMMMLACPAAQPSSPWEHMRCHALPRRGAPVSASFQLRIRRIAIVGPDQVPPDLPTPAFKGTAGSTLNTASDHTQIAEAAHPPGICPQLQIAAPCLPADYPRAQAMPHRAALSAQRTMHAMPHHTAGQLTLHELLHTTPATTFSLSSRRPRHAAVHHPKGRPSTESQSHTTIGTRPSTTSLSSAPDSHTMLLNAT